MTGDRSCTTPPKWLHVCGSPSQPSSAPPAPVRAGSTQAPQHSIVLASKLVSAGYSSYAPRSRPAPSVVARCASSPASKIRMSLPQSLSTLVHARQPQLPSRERLRPIQRSPPRDTRPGSCRKRLPGATLRPLHEYPPLRAAFPRPFLLQSPPSLPQPVHRTPLTTSHERSFNQSYFATIPFRAVIRPIGNRVRPESEFEVQIVKFSMVEPQSAITQHMFRRANGDGS